MTCTPSDAPTEAASTSSPRPEAHRPLMGLFFSGQEPEEAALPPRFGQFGDVIVASNGVFLHIERAGVAEALIPLAPTLAHAPLPGAGAALIPFIRLTYPRIPAALLRLALSAARAAAAGMPPLEALFHWTFDEACGEWILDVPPQRQATGMCQPTEDGVGSSHASALCELHSHHHMPAFFSSTDDADERDSRFYAVLGRVLERPTVLLRYGHMGHFWPLPASVLFELPPEIEDALAMQPSFERGLRIQYVAEPEPAAESAPLPDPTDIERMFWPERFTERVDLPLCEEEHEHDQPSTHDGDHEASANVEGQ